MQATAEYTVTKAAGPRVAGRPVKPGQHIALTEAQARAELLAGAIVPKAADAKDGAEPPDGAFKVSGAIDDIRARAKGGKGATPAEPEPAAAVTAPAATEAEHHDGGQGC